MSSHESETPPKPLGAAGEAKAIETSEQKLDSTTDTSPASDPPFSGGLFRLPKDFMAQMYRNWLRCVRPGDNLTHH
jgi:hypothetical protein